MRPILILSLLIMTIASSSARELLVYIGTYTKTSKGIYVGRFDTATGKAKPSVSDRRGSLREYEPPCK